MDADRIRPFWAAVLGYRDLGGEIVDPRPYAQGEIRDAFRKYPGVGPVLPAMGYGARQMQDLARTIAATPCDLVLVGTPIDLARVVRIDKPCLRVRYELAEEGPELAHALDRAVDGRRPRMAAS